MFSTIMLAPSRVQASAMNWPEDRGKAGVRLGGNLNGFEFSKSGNMVGAV
jgi:hypothetical protein